MKRTNAQGCLAALIVGFALGAFRLAVDTPVTLGVAGYEQGYTPGSFLWIVNNIYFQYYSLGIFLTSAAVMVGVSYMTPEPSAQKIENLTFATTTAEHRAESRSSWNQWDVTSSGIVLLLILAAYLYFNG
jgi:SSS family solute:Na+ symporter